MTTILLILAAVVILGWQSIAPRVQSVWVSLPRPEVSRTQIAAAGLIIAAVVAWHWDQGVAPRPLPPPPAPAGPLDLTGLFTGQTGAEDAAIVAALCGELADEIAWDGRQDEPFLATGVALDDLRRRAREMRCRGVSIGARQPQARDAIAAYLDENVGNEGGPVDAEQRERWFQAFRDISEAAARVTQ